MNRTLLSRINSIIIFFLSIGFLVESHMMEGIYLVFKEGLLGYYGSNYFVFLIIFIGMGGFFLSFFVWKEKRWSFILTAILSLFILISNLLSIIGWVGETWAVQVVILSIYVLITSIILFFKKENKQI